MAQSRNKMCVHVCMYVCVCVFIAGYDKISKACRCHTICLSQH